MFSIFQAEMVLTRYFDCNGKYQGEYQETQWFECYQTSDQSNQDEARTKLDSVLKETDFDCHSLCHYAMCSKNEAATYFLFSGDKPLVRIDADGSSFARILREAFGARNWTDVSVEGLRIFQRQSPELRKSIIALAKTWDIPADEFLQYAM